MSMTMTQTDYDANSRDRQRRRNQETLRVSALVNGWLLTEVGTGDAYTYATLDEVFAHQRRFFESRGDRT